MSKDADPANDGRVIGIQPVAVQLLEIRTDDLQVIERVGPQRVARQLGDLPGGQAGDYAAGERIALFLETVDLVADIDLGVIADESQLVNLRLELGDWLLKIEKLQIHRPNDPPGRTATL